MRNIAKRELRTGRSGFVNRFLTFRHALALQLGMAVSQYSSSSLVSPTKANHRPTLTTLLNTTDLSAATSSFDLDGDGEARDHSIELPDAPELNHELFQGEEFDPSTFLLGRRHTGLEDLRSEVCLLLLSL